MENTDKWLNDMIDKGLAATANSWIERAVEQKNLMNSFKPSLKKLKQLRKARGEALLKSLMGASFEKYPGFSSMYLTSKIF